MAYSFLGWYFLASDYFAIFQHDVINALPAVGMALHWLRYAHYELNITFICRPFACNYISKTLNFTIRSIPPMNQENLSTGSNILSSPFLHSVSKTMITLMTAIRAELLYLSLRNTTKRPSSLPPPSASYFSHVPHGCPFSDNSETKTFSLVVSNPSSPHCTSTHSFIQIGAQTLQLFRVLTSLSVCMEEHLGI